MVLQAKALLAGLGLAAAAAVAIGSKESQASAASGGKKATGSSAGKTTPSGVDPAFLAAQTTDALTRQDIAKLRSLVASWTSAGDPSTAAALSEDTEESVKGTRLEEWTGDGSKGSPLLRAFGERVLLVEGRPEKLLLWHDAWVSVLPVLAQALKTKSDAIHVDPSKGTTDDPQMPSDLLSQIIAAETAGDPTALRVLADQVEAAGFPDAAADLRAMADMIESQQVKPPNPAKPAPPSPPAPYEPQPAATDVPPPPPPRVVVPPAQPSGGPGRTVIVLKGEGPYQVTARLLGQDQAGRFSELVKANVPPKKKASNGGFTSLNPGEALKIPDSWPATKYDVHQTGAITQNAPTTIDVPAMTVTAAPSGDRYVTVQKGEGPIAVTDRVLGAGQGNLHWKELVAANSPPKKKASNGNFATLAIGERLKVPTNWPDSPQMTLGADGPSATHAAASARQTHAGKIAMAAYLGRLDRDLMAEWQRREKIPASGEYDMTSAYVLCFRFGMVPPVPKFAGPQSRKKFAAQMMAAARKDPQRSDEYLARAKAALGKAA